MREKMQKGRFIKMMPHDTGFTLPVLGNPLTVISDIESHHYFCKIFIFLFLKLSQLIRMIKYFLVFNRICFSC